MGSSESTISDITSGKNLSSTSSNLNTTTTTNIKPNDTDQVNLITGLWVGFAILVIALIIFVILYVLAYMRIFPSIPPFICQTTPASCPTCPSCLSPQTIPSICPSCQSCPISSPCPNCPISSPCPSCQSCPNCPISSPCPSCQSRLSFSSLSTTSRSLINYYQDSGCPTDTYIPWGSYLQSVNSARYDPITNTLFAEKINSSSPSSSLMELNMATCAAGSGVSLDNTGLSLVCDIPYTGVGSHWLPFCSTSANNGTLAPVTEIPNNGGTTMLPGGTWFQSCNSSVVTSNNNIFSAQCNNNSGVSLSAPIDQCPMAENYGLKDSTGNYMLSCAQLPIHSSIFASSSPSPSPSPLSLF